MQQRGQEASSFQGSCLFINRQPSGSPNKKSLTCSTRGSSFGRDFVVLWLERRELLCGKASPSLRVVFPSTLKVGRPVVAFGSISDLASSRQDEEVLPTPIKPVHRNCFLGPSSSRGICPPCTGVLRCNTHQSHTSPHNHKALPGGQQPPSPLAQQWLDMAQVLQRWPIAAQPHSLA